METSPDDLTMPSRPNVIESLLKQGSTVEHVEDMLSKMLNSPAKEKLIIMYLNTYKDANLRAEAKERLNFEES